MQTAGCNVFGQCLDDAPINRTLAVTERRGPIHTIFSNTWKLYVVTCVGVCIYRTQVNWEKGHGQSPAFGTARPGTQTILGASILRFSPLDAPPKLLVRRQFPRGGVRRRAG